ncbi:hypothetical protein [Mesorhizobium sp. M1252]|uniref:hypothetical protein n=1 Tax=Mesorhizobium sp. M1252 TaxID=2957073 RepID=UPI00333E07E5
MLKPACRYKTRLGRRIAIICYMPLIPILAILVMGEAVARDIPPFCRDVASVWRQ